MLKSPGNPTGLSVCEGPWIFPRLSGAIHIISTKPKTLAPEDQTNPKFCARPRLGQLLGKLAYSPSWRPLVAIIR